MKRVKLILLGLQIYHYIIPLDSFQTGVSETANYGGKITIQLSFIPKQTGKTEAVKKTNPYPPI